MSAVVFSKGGAGTGEAKQADKTPMESVIDDVRDRATGLRDCILKLQARLNNVLIPDPRVDEESPDSSKAEPSSSPAVSILRLHATDLSDMRYLVQDILDRLEV